jgi:hypothetical protein
VVEAQLHHAPEAANKAMTVKASHLVATNPRIFRLHFTCFGLNVALRRSYHGRGGVGTTRQATKNKYDRIHTSHPVDITYELT